MHYFDFETISYRIVVSQSFHVKIRLLVISPLVKTTVKR